MKPILRISGALFLISSVNLFGKGNEVSFCASPWREMRVESEMGNGTAFTVSLPIEPSS